MPYQPRARRPLSERKDYNPALRKDYYKVPFDEIIACYTEVAATTGSRGKAYVEVSKRLNIPVSYVAKMVNKNFTQARVAEVTSDIAEKIFEKKVPMLQNIVGVTLCKLEKFVQTVQPESIQEAKDLAAIVTNFNNLLRLELGQSTQNVEVIQKVQKDITVVLKNLSEKDPFVDYPVTLDISDSK